MPFRLRAPSLRDVVNAYVLGLVITSVVRPLLSKAAYTSDLGYDIHYFIHYSTPFSSVIRPLASDTSKTLYSSLFEKVHHVLLNVIGFDKMPLWLTKLLSFVMVLCYTIPKTIFGGITLTYVAVYLSMLMIDDYRIVAKLAKVIAGWN